MKLLILGNHTCGNRGDSAILRGLLDAINSLNPHAEVDVMSRYPVSSSWLLNRPVMGDPLFLQMKQHNSAAGVVGRVKKVLRRRYQHQVLLSRVTDTGKLRNIAIAQGFTDFVRLLSGYDAIIQVGGSFFVDLYGVPQFEHALCTFMAKKPLFMIGHSVGPFQDEQFNQLANYVFGHCDALILRESVSLDLMKRSNITTAKVEHGVDTAWLVDHHTEEFTASYAVQHWLDVAAQQKTVAITLRELAPFDKRLGTTQQAYEKAFAGVVNRILDEGYQVIALSTCTGIDSYNKDDRMVALNLRQHISDPARYHVVMDELNDLEMGKILGACELTVGTRLHSAIISMNFATPAIAINYEHKSAGIMQQLGLPEMAIDIRHLLDGSLQAMVADTLGQLPVLNARLSEAVSRERQIGMQMVQSVLERSRGGEMKVGFFLLKFPLSSETFVLNQITAFIDMGFEVEIVALQKGDTQNTHAAWTKYNLAARTRWLQDEPQGKVAKLRHRASQTLRGIHRKNTWQALNLKRYGAESRNLILSAICGQVATPFRADVFIAHFGPAGVTAAKLRELGVIRGKIATIFHGIDISSREVLNHYTPEYQQLFRRGDLMLPISDLWAGRLQKMGCPREKIAVSRMGVDMTRFSPRPVKAPATPLEIISVARLTEKKGLHVAIEACRQLKEQGVAFRYRILGIGPWERRLRTLIEQYQLEDVVEMPGFKPSHEVKAMLDDADVFLLPSVTGADGDMEGIPVALMEAMAVGIPVVSTLHSGIPELVEADKSGWLVPENDARALAQRLAAFSQLDTDELAPVIKRAREKVEHDFNQQVINRELASLLQAL
ncbi:colanic acid biosynthesis protein WcaK [Escherichia coli H591]|nr:colanic acid biosynthesis protein WcaK [Escherichia coli H591]